MARSLDATTRNVLNLAAIVGGRMNDLSIYRLVDATTGETLAALSRLFDLRLLRDRGEGVEFVNELVRGRVYLGMPSPVRKALHNGVADLLLAADTEERRVPGLELAWHLIRAERPAEATPHLLRGAKEAMWAGAPHATQHALSTALPWLAESVQASARLLLAEALQEQGCWLESLQVLRSGADQTADEVQLLRAHATYQIDSSRESAAALLPEVLTILRRRIREPVAVDAAAVMGRLAGYLRDRHSAALGLESLAAVHGASLSLEQRAKLALARAHLEFARGDRTNSMRALLEGAEILQQTSLMSSVAVRIHHGLATLDTLSGRYEAAKSMLRRAYHQAQGLGNETTAGTLAAELALVCLRLGELDELEGWVDRAKGTLGEGLAGYREVQTTYTAATLLALRGHYAQAVDTVGRFDRKIERHTPPFWIRQVWSGYRTDVLMLCGRTRTALDSAMVLVNNEPETIEQGIRGTYGRWLGLAGEQLLGREATTRRLGRLVASIEELDALDQVEVGLAALQSGLMPDDALAGPMKHVRTVAQRLPPAALDHLERLGIRVAPVRG